MADEIPLPPPLLPQEAEGEIVPARPKNGATAQSLINSDIDSLDKDDLLKLYNVVSKALAQHNAGIYIVKAIEKNGPLIIHGEGKLEDHEPTPGFFREKLNPPTLIPTNLIENSKAELKNKIEEKVNTLQEKGVSPDQIESVESTAIANVTLAYYIARLKLNYLEESKVKNPEQEDQRIASNDRRESNAHYIEEIKNAANLLYPNKATREEIYRENGLTPDLELATQRQEWGARPTRRLDKWGEEPMMDGWNPKRPPIGLQIENGDGPNKGSAYKESDVNDHEDPNGKHKLRIKGAAEKPELLQPANKPQQPSWLPFPGLLLNRKAAKSQADGEKLKLPFTENDVKNPLSPEVQKFAKELEERNRKARERAEYIKELEEILGGAQQSNPQFRYGPEKTNADQEPSTNDQTPDTNEPWRGKKIAIDLKTLRPIANWELNSGDDPADALKPANIVDGQFVPPPKTPRILPNTSPEKLPTDGPPAKPIKTGKER